MKLTTSLLLFLFFLSIRVLATDYYVARAGNDANPGTMALPWKTIAKVNASIFKPGDRILFKSGETFFGGIVAYCDGLTFTTYGGTERAVISGYQNIWVSTPLSDPRYPQPVVPPGWTNEGNNVWSTSLPSLSTLKIAKFGPALDISTPPNQVARFPLATAANGGYLTNNGVTNPTPPGLSTISSAAIPPGDWTGADICIRKNDYVIDRHRVNSISGNTITYSNVDFLDPFKYDVFGAMVGYGFFFQNHRLAIQNVYDWAFNESERRLYIKFATQRVGSNPLGTGPLNIATVQTLMDINFKSNITVTSLIFNGANKFGVYGALKLVNNSVVSQPSNVSVSNCAFIDIGGRGVALLGVNNVLVEHCYFSYCLSTGVELHWPSEEWVGNGKTVRYCKFENIAPFPGMSSYLNQADLNGVFVQSKVSQSVSGSNTLIHNNTFTNISKAAVNFQGTNIEVSQNNIINACKDVRDYGAIYTYMQRDINVSNRVVKENIISSCVGSFLGSTATDQSICGIYLDGITKNVTVQDNTVSTCSNAGIYCQSPSNISVISNLLYQNDVALKFSRWDVDDININVKKNIFYSTNPAKPYIFYVVTKFDVPNTQNTPELELAGIGTLDSNYYGTFNETPFVVEFKRANNTYLTINPMSLKTWRIKTMQEGLSGLTPAVQQYQVTDVSANLFTNPTFQSNVSGLSNGGGANITHVNSTLLGSFAARVAPAITPEPNRFMRIFCQVPNVTNVKNYHVKCTTATENTNAEGILTAYMRDAAENVLTPKITRSFSNEVRTHDFVFTAASSTFPAGPFVARFAIDMQTMSGPTHIDNLEVYEASVVENDLSQLAFFADNPVVDNVSLNWRGLPPGNYVDVLGNAYTGSITLAPYKSALLFRTGTSGRPAKAEAILPVSIAGAEVKCYPNPARNVITVGPLDPAAKWETIELTDAAGRTFFTKPVQGQASINVQIGALSKGQYLFTLRNRATVRSIKFVKM